jgi:hypothetical protein
MSLAIFINEHWVYKENMSLTMVIYEYREYVGHQAKINHPLLRDLLLAKGFTVVEGNKVVPSLRAEPMLRVG